MQPSDLAYKELGNEPTSKDTRGDFTIYRIESTNNDRYPSLEYVILNDSKLKVVKKGHISMGSVKWLNQNQIEILDLPRIMPSGKTMADFRKVINLY